MLTKDHVPQRNVVNLKTNILVNNMHCQELNLDKFKGDFYFP